MVYFTSKSSTLQEQLIQISEGLDFDELLIVSGYVGPGPLISLKLIDGIKLNVIFGLAIENVSKSLHNELLKIELEKKYIKIFYSNVPSHVKIYIWRKNGAPVYCVNGSANFTSNGLLKPFREILALVPASQFKSIMSYIKLIQDSSFSLNKYVPKVNISNSYNEEERIQSVDTLFISSSLYAEKSKINWGHGNAHTNPRDAYLPISSLDIKRFPHLFPPKTGNRGLRYSDNDPIDIVWDDGTIMVGILEGTQKVNGERYPNKIGSFRNKKILGDYLRKRMGLEQGVFVTETDFINYGRDNVGIKKIGDSTYQFDFSKLSTA